MNYNLTIIAFSTSLQLTASGPLGVSAPHHVTEGLKRDLGLVRMTTLNAILMDRGKRKLNLADKTTAWVL